MSIVFVFNILHQDLEEIRPQLGESAALGVPVVLHQHDHLLHAAADSSQQCSLQIMEVDLKHLTGIGIQCYGHEILNTRTYIFASI